MFSFILQLFWKKQKEHMLKSLFLSLIKRGTDWLILPWFIVYITVLSAWYKEDHMSQRNPALDPPDQGSNLGYVTNN